MTIELYSTGACPFCVRARQLLVRKGFAYEEVRVDLDPRRRFEMEERSGRHTVPQIFISGRHIGGCDELFALDRSGRLDQIVHSG